MGFRFRKSIKIAPGIRLNVGKRGVSVSAGIRGASVTYGARGLHANASIPGTGVSYRERLDGGGATQRGTSAPTSAPRTELPIDLELQQDGSVLFRTVDGTELPDHLAKEARRQGRDSILVWLQANCAKINEEIEGILNLHLHTPPPDKQITYHPRPFKEKLPQYAFVRTIAFVPTPPTPAKSNFLSKIWFVKSARERAYQKLYEAYEQELALWQSQKIEYDRNVEESDRLYRQQMNEYEAKRAKFNEQELARKHRVEHERLANPEAMSEFFEESLGNLVWPRETIVSFEIVDGGTRLFLDVDLPEIEDLPDSVATVSTRNLQIVYKDKPKGQVQKDYLQHIHAIGFRIIGEAFTCLPSVQSVTFSGYSQRANKQTGHVQDDYLYSAQVSREVWQQINFSNLAELDLVACFEVFDLRRKITKTGVITPIVPHEFAQ